MRGKGSIRAAIVAATAAAGEGRGAEGNATLMVEPQQLHAFQLLAARIVSYNAAGCSRARWQTAER